jgi:hypothetical protein
LLRGLLRGWLNDGSMMAQGWFRDGSGMAQGWSSQEQNSLRGWLLGSGAGCWVQELAAGFAATNPYLRAIVRTGGAQPGAARSSQEQPGAEFVRIRHRIRQTQQPGAARSSQEQNSSEFVTEFASSGMAQGIAQGMAP